MIETMRYLATATLITAASCGAGGPHPTNSSGGGVANELHSANGTSVVVRLARDGEFPSTRPADQPRRECEKAGPLVNEYYEPLVAFAREQLVRNEPGPFHAFLVSPGERKPKLADGVNIVVEPRGTLGELRIVMVGPPFYAPGESWAGSDYCLHVLQSSGTATIAVEETSSWIR